MERFLHIKKIEYTEARYLADLVVVKNTGVLLQKWRNFQTLPTIDFSSLTSETKIVDRETIFTLKLSAELPTNFSVAGRRLCYRLTTISGGQFLMGTNDKPYVITTVEDHYPANITKKSITKLSAEYSNIFGLLAILD